MVTYLRGQNTKAILPDCMYMYDLCNINFMDETQPQWGIIFNITHAVNGFYFVFWEHIFLVFAFFFFLSSYLVHRYILVSLLSVIASRNKYLFINAFSIGEYDARDTVM